MLTVLFFLPALQDVFKGERNLSTRLENKFALINSMANIYFYPRTDQVTFHCLLTTVSKQSAALILFSYITLATRELVVYF